MKKLLAQIGFVIFILVLWQVLFEMKIWPKLLFPSVPSVGDALVKAFSKRELGAMILHSLGLLLKGLIAGVILAFILSSLFAVNEYLSAIYNMIVSMFDLIPGIALIPVAILWLGIGDNAIVFMVIHSVIWPMSRSIIDGFKAVPRIYREVGMNMGLSGMRLIMGVYLPASFERLFSGIRVGWARAWRGLISAEMVFGGGSALGIGYFITDRRTNLDIAGIFAAIIVIVLIGLVVEYGIFRIIEKNTVVKWGMTH